MIQSAAQYHQHTSYDRHDMSGHNMDWQNQPSVFKEYPGIEPIPLPRDVPLPSEPFSTLFEKREKDASPATLGLETLSTILLLTHTLTAKARHADGDFYFRSPASAGALYPNEIYVAPKGLSGLEDGLYHFSIQHHGLSRLRKGALSGIEDKTLTFFFTAIFFRSAWKYRDRSYRYHLLDAGHLLDNMILALKALHLPFTVSYDFDDTLMNHLLGLDQTKEVTLAMLHLPQGADDAGSVHEEIPGLSEKFQKASRVSGNEIDYPAVREMHQAGASSLVPEEPLPRMEQELGIDADSWGPIPDPTHSPEIVDYPEALFRRRSKRNFIPKPISRDSLYRLLHTQCKLDSKDTEKAPYQHAVCTGFIVGNAEGMEPGLYLLDPLGKSAGMVTPGTFLKEMAHICLDQMWLANAGIHFLYMTNMNILDQVWGARGYRYAMLTAGRMGQRLYIAATSMGLGCCGIGALYDGEAAQLLGLNKSSKLLYLVAIGQIKRE
ncbi:MAG: SagB/ThcOx family dehydrogenase [Deltaproteobacteria bacterium]|nr:SagB/ThcOx family dehydrogenase [Deltaproteobacteria bacterium]